MQELQDCSKDTHRLITCVVEEVLTDAAARERLVQGLALSAFDKGNARAVLETHAGRWDAANLLEVNNVCDGGPEILAALRRRFGDG